MQNHIFRAIPDLEEVPEPADREDRLRIIIANLEKHHQEARASMLDEARRKREVLSAGEESTDGMDLDGHEAADHRQLIANLNASYVDGSGDPCLPDDTIPTAETSPKQAPVPLEVQIAQEVIEQMEAYDKNAKQARDFYVKALEKQRGRWRSPEPALGSRTPTDGSRDPRRKPTG